MPLGGLIFAVVAAAVIIVAAGSQIVAYRRGQTLLTRGQLVLRLVIALLLLAVLALSGYAVIAQGELIKPEMSRSQQLGMVRGIAFFWSAVTLLLLAVMILAVIDLRYVRAAQHRARATMYRNLANLQQELKAQATAKAQGKTEGDSADEDSSPGE